MDCKLTQEASFLLDCKLAAKSGSLCRPGVTFLSSKMTCLSYGVLPEATFRTAPSAQQIYEGSHGQPLTNLLRSGRHSSLRLPLAGVRRRVLRLVDAVALLAARALVVGLRRLLGLCLASLGFARRCRSSRHALACRLGLQARFARPFFHKP